MVFMTLMNTLREVQRLESRHRGALEKKAVEIVLDLPEFKDAKEDVESGHLIIRAKLLGKMPDAAVQSDMERIEPPDPSEEEISTIGLNVPQIQMEIDPEVKKRKFLNLMIQGAGVTKTSAYHLANEMLHGIDPCLLYTSPSPRD